MSRRDISLLLSGGTFANDMFHIGWNGKYNEFANGQKGTDYDKAANILLNGGEIMLTDMFVERLFCCVDNVFECVGDEYHNGNNLKTSIETVMLDSKVYDKEVYRNATYHITLQDILNGINKDNAKPYIEKGLLDKIGDYKHTNALLQLIVFNEMIYNIYGL